MKAIVKKSPWPNRLPDGTRIVSTTPRGGKSKVNGTWFVRGDGKLIFEEELDGKFKLFPDEFEKID